MFDRIMDYLRGPGQPEQPTPAAIFSEVAKLRPATDALLAQHRAGAISPVDTTRLERNRIRLGELGIHIVIEEEEEEEEEA